MIRRIVRLIDILFLRVTAVVELGPSRSKRPSHRRDSVHYLRHGRCTEYVRSGLLQVYVQDESRNEKLCEAFSDPESRAVNGTKTPERNRSREDTRLKTLVYTVQVRGTGG